MLPNPSDRMYISSYFFLMHFLFITASIVDITIFHKGHTNIGVDHDIEKIFQIFVMI